MINLNSTNGKHLSDDRTLVFDRLEKRKADRKSIGEDRITPKKNARVEFTTKRRIQALFGSAIVALSIYGGVKLTQDVTKRVDYYIDTRAAVCEAEDIMSQRLIDNNCALIDKSKEFHIKDMGVEDYRSLGISTPTELYALMAVVDDKSEADEMTQAMTYVDTNGNECNYNGYYQYLNVNGYFDSDHVVSGEVFENMSKNELCKMYREGTLSENLTVPTKGGMNK